MIFAATIVMMTSAFSMAENYTIGLLYPLRNVKMVSDFHYFGAFMLAMNEVNEQSERHNLNLTIHYTVEDSSINEAQVQANDTDQLSLNNMRNIAEKSLQGYDGFVGPGTKACNWEARLTAALNKPLVGYQCNDALVSNKKTFPTFGRTYPSTTSYLSGPIAAILKRYGWKRLMILAGNQEASQIAQRKLKENLQEQGFTVFSDIFLRQKNASFYSEFFKKIRESARVLVYINDLGGYSHSDFILEAYNHGLANGEYVFYFINNENIYYLQEKSLSYCGVSWGKNLDSILEYQNTKSNCNPKKMLEILRYSFILSQWSTADDKNVTDFKNKIEEEMLSVLPNCRGEFDKYFKPECKFSLFLSSDDNKIPLAAFQLYNAVILYFNALKRTTEKDQNIRDGVLVMSNTRNTNIQKRSINIIVIGSQPVPFKEKSHLQVGFFLSHDRILSSGKCITSDIARCGKIYASMMRGIGYDIAINDNMETTFTFTLLSVQNLKELNLTKYDYDWYPFGQFEDQNGIYVLNAPNKKIDWPDFPPKDTPECGFFNETCLNTSRGSEEDNTMLVAVLVIMSFLVIGAVYAGIYVYRRRLLLSNMSWKIEESEIHITVHGMDASRMSLASRIDDDVCFLPNPCPRPVPALQLFTKVALYKSQLVAVKPFKRSKLLMNRPVLEELRDMLNMSHENINPFLGMVLNPTNENMIIFQYCPKGSLSDVLSNEDIKLDSMFLSSFVKDIIKGMAYLHHSSLKSHGRLKSHNCIIDSRWMIKITDYGTNFLRSGLNPLRECDNNAFYSGLLWTAPEHLRTSNPPSNGTQKGDVYSFGIILQEIITRTEPYAMHELDAIDIIARVKNRSNPPFRPAVQKYHVEQTFSDSPTSIELYNLMRQCLSEDPNERPTFSETRKFMKRISRGKETNVFEHMVKMLEKYSNHLEKVVEERTKQLIEEKKKTDDLVHRMLPKFIADQLKNNGHVEAERYDEVTIYFSDIVGFTTISGQSTPMQVVDLLNDLYTLFDRITDSYDAYKVETIGDAYMLVSGLPIRNGHLHASQIADLSLHLLRAVDEEFIIRHQPNTKLKIRIGLHSGPVAAGVVGFTMPRYCLFGDTVNKASRMESNGIALKVHISGETKELLDIHQQYLIEPRDEKVELKNVGVVQTYWLLEKRDFSHSKNDSSTSICSSGILLPPSEKTGKQMKKLSNRGGSNFNLIKKNNYVSVA